MRRRLARRCRARRGILSTEALFIIPALLLISIGIVEFGILLSVQQAVAHAAIEAAKEAGKGATIDDLEPIVEESLTAFNITIGSEASILLEDPEAMTIDQAGTLDCDPPASPTVADGNVRVTVCVASTNTPVVGQLESLGFSGLVGKILTKSAVVKKEFP
jgi:Flp pilus assembly protein TadG